MNNNIVPRKLKTMDRRLHWIRCREAQGQFQYYWASGSLNWGDYSNKYHPPSITNRKECNLREIQTASKTSGTGKVPERVYCSCRSYCNRVPKQDPCVKQMRSKYDSLSCVRTHRPTYPSITYQRRVIININTVLLIPLYILVSSALQC